MVSCQPSPTTLLETEYWVQYLNLIAEYRERLLVQRLPHCSYLVSRALRSVGRFESSCNEVATAEQSVHWQTMASDSNIACGTSSQELSF